MIITDELKEDVLYYLVGTCKNEAELEEQFNLTCDEVEDILSEIDIEVYQGCEWWFRSYELVDEDDNDGFCDDCRQET